MMNSVAVVKPKPPGEMIYHPPCIDMMTDIGSIGHVALGWIASGLKPSEAIAILALFSGYQISQSQSGESWPRIGGELLEFGLGMLLGRFTRKS
jgi:hypothetical protein